MSLIVKVYTQNIDHYKSLRLKITRESAPSGLLHSLKLDTSSHKMTENTNHGVVVQVPPLPLDGKLYTVQIESTSPTYNSMTSVGQSFTTDSAFKYVDLVYEVKIPHVEQQIKQTSLWTLVFMFSVLAVFYKIDYLINFVKERIGSINLNSLNAGQRNKSPVRDYVVDTNEIDQIVESINPKRKVKSRKT